ncbi:glycosyltransferase family 4 protein [Streptomyces triculaminicus]|uniref:D-inositol 3-phosphate glycosyltransferase n=1 Tax=Streptomyces triculaminicus TaxID=2816232 RepID=A0A939FN02_9ACTN|nr:glycosyltransferase family 4 protein [Streptomyces triculaminicus]MBO0654227.1 glycosyltransferase family 4 protein [Streptomyces triculaminicus]
MRIHMWTADTAGSGWYRGHLVGMSLAWLGHQVTVGVRLPGDWEQLDAVVGCRVAIPGASKAWRQMKAAGVRLVLDLDDDYFHLDPANTTACATWTPALQAALAENLCIAHVVTCCSEPLAKVLRAYHHDVRVIGNGLPAQYLGTPRDYDPETLRVGWAGSSSTLAELPIAARALNRISVYERPALVRLVGVTPEQAMAAGLRGGRVGALGWVPDQNHYLQAADEFDIWVAPYRDIPFNRAKFATKALEAGFLGIPLIASDIEPYRQAVDHGVTGFLVRRDHEWGRYLKQLADDPELRQSMGMAARARASGSILQALNQQWEKALTAPDRPPPISAAQAVAA